MTPARRRAFALVAVVAIAALAIASTAPRHASTASAKRPTLLLLTSLPLVFGEDFSLHGGSPALKALEANFRVIPISVASPSELSRGRLLLMAQPLAQAPDNLVALDNWVRAGGRVLLLADPALEWPSTRPLGDPLRPTPMFADTGLLAHWGLRLDAPDAPGPATRKLAGRGVATLSPGSLYGSCRISADRLYAECRVGKGWAAVVADADLLDVDVLGPDAKDNLEAVTQELAQLANR